MDWYRQTQQEQHIVTEPSELGFVADNRRTATQVVRLAFDFARQHEEELAKRSPSNKSGGASSGGSQYQSLATNATAADQLVQQTQSEVEALKQKLEHAAPSKRRQLEDQIAETQSELGLFQARQQALHSMLEFASGATTGGGATSLRAQIDELSHTVPPAANGIGAVENTSGADQQQTKAPEIADMVEHQTSAFPFAWLLISDAWIG